MHDLSTKAVFLDRDGVLNAVVFRQDESAWDSPYTLDELQVLPEAPKAIRAFQDAGYLAIVVSNQPGVAKGKCDLAFLDAVTARLRDTVAASGARLDDVLYCLHHPQAVLPEYRVQCACRKPKPGLLWDAALRHGINMGRSYFIGDRPTDLQAAMAAGCTPVFLPSPASGVTQKDVQAQWPTALVCDDLLDAARRIARRERADARATPRRTHVQD